MLHYIRHTFVLFLLLLFLSPVNAQERLTIEQQQVEFWFSRHERPAVRLCAVAALKEWVPVSWLRQRVMAYMHQLSDAALVEVLVNLLAPADVDRITGSHPVNDVILHGNPSRVVPADTYGRIPIHAMDDLKLQAPLSATFQITVPRPSRVRLTAAGGAPGTWCINGQTLKVVPETQSSVVELDLPAGEHRIGVIWSYVPQRPLLRISNQAITNKLRTELASIPSGCPSSVNTSSLNNKQTFNLSHRNAQEINNEAMAQCDLAFGRLPDEDALLRFVPMDPHFRAKVALLKGENPAPWLPPATPKQPWIAYENDLILAEHWMETRVTEPARILWENLATYPVPSVRSIVRATQLQATRGLPTSAAQYLLRLVEQFPGVAGIWRAAIDVLDAAQMDSLGARTELLRLLPWDISEILVAAEVLHSRGKNELAVQYLSEGWATLHNLDLLTTWYRLTKQQNRGLSEVAAFPWFEEWFFKQNRFSAAKISGYHADTIPPWLVPSILPHVEFPNAQNRLNKTLSAAEIVHLDQVLQIEPDGISRYSRRVLLLVRDPRTATLEPFTITYAPHSQNLRILRTHVHHVDGAVSARAASVTSDEMVNGPARMYFDLRQVRITFPPVASGDILELWYVLEDLPVMHGLEQASFGHIVSMQERFRIASQRLRVLPPTKIKLKYRLSRKAGVQVTQGSTDGQPWLEFRTQAIDAWRDEISAPGWGETLLTLQLGTANDWREIGTVYWRFVEPLYRLRPAWRDLAQKITSHSRTDLERIQAVHAWVQRNFRYVSLMFGEHGYLPYSVEEILERRFGDCKDMTLLMVVLLQSLGIEARPAIIRTRDMGNLPLDVPALAPFNHSVVYLPAYQGWIDGTVKGLLFPIIPAWIQGRKALVIWPNKGELVSVPSDPSQANQDSYDFLLSIGENQRAEIVGRMEIRGQPEAVWRQYLEGDTRGALLRLLHRIWPEATLTSWSTSDLATLSSPLSIRFLLYVPKILQKRNRGMSLQLDFGAGAELSRLISNPVRHYDFQLDYPFIRVWKASLALHRSWCIKKIPRTIELTTPHMSFKQAFSCSKNRCQLERRLHIQSERIGATDYPLFIDTLNRALLALHEELVLTYCK